MKLNIQAVNFEMASKLEEFIGKKTAKLAKFVPADADLDIHMTVVKPATNLNKLTKVSLDGLFAEKTCDTFEEGLQECIAALEKQLEKRKDK